MLKPNALEHAHIALLFFVYISIIYLVSFVAYPLKYDAYAAYQGRESLVPVVLSIFSFQNIALMILGATAFLYCSYKKLFFTCSPLLIVFLNSALLSHAYLEPGWLITGDANAHVARVAHLMKANQEGIFSGWSNFFYGGTPVLQFYAPLFFQLSALLGQLIDSAHWSIKIILFTCNIVSAIGMYYFLRFLRLPAAVAIIGALIYAGSFAHIHLVLFRGMFPQALIFMLIPWLFYYANLSVLLFQKKKYLYVLLLTLTLAAMMATHIISAFYIYVLLALFLFWRYKKTYFQTIIMVLLGAGCLAACMTSYTIFPVFFEKSGLMMENLPFTAMIALPPWESVSFLFLFRQGPSGAGGITFFGYLPVLLAVAGIIFTKHKKDIAIFLVLFLVCVIFKLNYVRPSVLLLFFISLLAAYGAALLYRIIPLKLYVTASILIFIELIASTIYPLSRTDKQFFEPLAQELQERFPHQRIVSANYEDGEYVVPIGPNGGILAAFDIQKLDGPHNMTAPKTHNYQVSVLRQLESDLNQNGTFSAEIKTILCLYNVGAMVTINHKTQNYDIVPTECASPVRFSQKMIQADPHSIKAESEMIWYETDQDAEHAKAAFETISMVAQSPYIMHRDDINPEQNIVQNIKDSKLTLKSYHVSRNDVHIDISASEAGYIRLAHPVYHGLKVTQNDKVVVPMQDISASMVLPIQAGDTYIHMTVEKSILRKILSYFSFISSCMVIGALLYMLFLERKRRHE